MKTELNRHETRYRRTIGNIGLAMCLFLLLFHGASYLLSALSILFMFLPITQVWHDVIFDLLTGICYLASFMLPVLFLRKKMRSDGMNHRPMYAEAKISPYLPIMLFAVIFLIRSSSYVNALWNSLFEVSHGPNNWYNEEMTPYQIVMEFIVTCVVPGFCEEFLFRGAILTNCLPFGRTKAIFISSFLFALMHANTAQFFYTFVAGILLGIVYEKTESIWNCVILHMFNNFFSLVDDIILANFSEYSVWLTMFSEVVISVLGIISIAFLANKFFSQKSEIDEGFYQKELPANDSYALCPIGASRAISLFFTPAVIVFLAMSLITAFL